MVVFKYASIFVASVSIIGNVLVCHVIVRLKNMKTSINYIILTLAIVDAISGILGILYVFLNDNYNALLSRPLLQQGYNKSPLLAEILCRLHRCYWLGVAVSPFLLVAMSFERYKAIAHPFSRLDSETIKSRLRVILPLLCLFGSAYGVIDLIIVTYEEAEKSCIDKIYPWFNTKVYGIAFTVTNFIIPSTAICFFYFRVICALRKQDNALGSQVEAERARRKARKKVMWTIILVTLVFYICCGIPHILVVVNSSFHLFNISLDVANDIFVIFASFNSAFNPFIYFIFIQSFRNGLKKVFMSRKDGGSTSLHSMRPTQNSYFTRNSICVPNQNKGTDTVPQLLSLSFKRELEC